MWQEWHLAWGETTTLPVCLSLIPMFTLVSPCFWCVSLFLCCLSLQRCHCVCVPLVKFPSSNICGIFLFWCDVLSVIFFIRFQFCTHLYTTTVLNWVVCCDNTQWASLWSIFFMPHFLSINYATILVASCIKSRIYCLDSWKKRPERWFFYVKRSQVS